MKKYKQSNKPGNKCKKCGRTCWGRICKRCEMKHKYKGARIYQRIKKRRK